MAKSPTKELERLEEQFNKGNISERQFKKLRQKTIDDALKQKSATSSPRSKKKGGNNTLKGIGLFLLLVVFGSSYNKNESVSDTKSATQTTKNATQKQCDQIWKDEGYYKVLRSSCTFMEDVDPIYRTESSDRHSQFKEYADRNGCSYNEEKATKISTDTSLVIMGKLRASQEKTGNIQVFCNAEKSYFGKVIKKYNIQ
ncbi:hypothetical protein [Mannheimia indoligenes]|uniref:SHOCT domain-containing protein n=1 Tax=Mannheimia indoligenes TaxID=3103145 RepID=A0ABU7ZHC4_9PAST